MPRVVSQVLDALSRGPNVLLVGPPGTGKTVALEDLRELFEKGASSLLFDPDILHDAWFELPPVPTGMVRTIVFHPSYSYEEFVIGLYPVPAQGAGVDLQPRPGPLLSIAHWASEGSPALLLIDEFNRGNAAAIFGDMLALLDKDKRVDLCLAKSAQRSTGHTRTFQLMSVRHTPPAPVRLYHHSSISLPRCGL